MCSVALFLSTLVFFYFRGIQQSTHTEDSCVVSRGVYSSLFLLISLHVQISLLCWNWIHNVIRKVSQRNQNERAISLFSFMKKKCTFPLSYTRTAKQNAQFRNVNMLQLINLGNLYSYPILKFTIVCSRTNNTLYLALTITVWRVTFDSSRGALVTLTRVSCAASPASFCKD